MIEQHRAERGNDMHFSLDHRSLGPRYSGSWNVSGEEVSETWSELWQRLDFQAWAVSAQAGDQFKTGLSAVFVTAWKAL